MMLEYPKIDPVAFSVGPLDVHWYGLMYLCGFLLAWWLGKIRAKKTGLFTGEDIADLIFYSAMGVVIGGRVGYMLFYAFPDFIAHPWSLFKIWQGGMSFHGGLVGVLVAMGLFARHKGTSFLGVVDFLAPLVPIGLGLGRLGNFINGELWGRVSHVPWAMVFPQAGPLARHPSQLYECVLEGVVLFGILWLYSAKPRPKMAVGSLFLLLYGLFRFGVEFFRQPDPQYGFIAFGWLTMGQLLSLPMIAVGGFALFLVYKRKGVIHV